MNTKRLRKTNILSKHFQYFGILLATVLLFAGCSTVQVSQDYAPLSKFMHGSSFNWNNEHQTINDDRFLHDELLAKRFKNAIEKSLFRQGLRLSSQPDYLVSYSYEISSKIQTEYIGPMFGFGYGSHIRYGGVGVEMGYSPRQYDQGKLEIYLHSALDGALIWKGTGTQEVHIHPNPDQLTLRINELVASVLAQFPPANL